MLDFFDLETAMLPLSRDGVSSSPLDALNSLLLSRLELLGLTTLDSSSSSFTGARLDLDFLDFVRRAVRAPAAEADLDGEADYDTD